LTFGGVSVTATVARMGSLAMTAMSIFYRFDATVMILVWCLGTAAPIVAAVEERIFCDF